MASVQSMLGQLKGLSCAPMVRCKQGKLLNTLLHFCWTVDFWHVNWHHFLVIGCWMVFGAVIHEVGCSWCPEEGELLPSDFISESMKAHGHCFWYALIDFIIENLMGSWIVCPDWSWWLFLAQFIQCVDIWNGLFWVVLNTRLCKKHKKSRSVCQFVPHNTGYHGKSAKLTKRHLPSLGFEPVTLLALSANQILSDWMHVFALWKLRRTECSSKNGFSNRPAFRTALLHSWVGLPFLLLQHMSRHSSSLWPWLTWIRWFQFLLSLKGNRSLLLCFWLLEPQGWPHLSEHWGSHCLLCKFQLGSDESQSVLRSGSMLWLLFECRVDFIG